jgi:hypothetical protein
MVDCLRHQRTVSLVQGKHIHMQKGKIPTKGQMTGLTIHQFPVLRFLLLTQRLLIRGEFKLGVGVKKKIAFHKEIFKVLEEYLFGLGKADLHFLFLNGKINRFGEERMGNEFLPAGPGLTLDDEHPGDNFPYFWIEVVFKL